MKGRGGKGPPSTDLLVCFPSRAHLTLMPKPICSPAKASEPNKRQHNHHQHHHSHHANHLHSHQHLKKSRNRGGGASRASPLLWAKTKPMNKEIAEPTSPTVTCAGQIKVRPKPSSCKNWQSVMEEIERLHNNRKNKKRSTWVEALGFKKDVMQFLKCLRRIRFDFRCFGSFPTAEITSDDEDDDDEDDEDYQENHVSREANGDNETSRTLFSKWFMVLQENSNKHLSKKDHNKDKERSNDEDSIDASCAPPNALLLMRCRSAPAKGWLEEREEEQEGESHDDDEDNQKQKQEEEDEKKPKLEMDEEKKRQENLAAMRCGTDFCKFSSDIAKETWVIGDIKETLSRSRSWKR